MGSKSVVILLLSLGLLGCQSTAKKAAKEDPNVINGFAHFDKEGSVSAKISPSSITFYKSKPQKFTRDSSADSDCEYFQGASGIICYKRDSQFFMANGKKIGRFAPFKSERSKVIRANSAKPVARPVEKATAENLVKAAAEPVAKPAVKPENSAEQ